MNLSSADAQRRFAGIRVTCSQENATERKGSSMVENRKPHANENSLGISELYLAVMGRKPQKTLDLQYFIAYFTYGAL